MQHDPDDFQLSGYRYELPEAHIAQHPPAQRGGSRLLALNRRTGHVRHSGFSQLAAHLPPRALLVANSSRVTAARLTGARATGGKVELLLLTPLPLLLEAARHKDGRFLTEADCLLRGAKKIPAGSSLAFGALRATVLEAGPGGQRRVLLEWQGDLTRLLANEGHIPLPPYIRRRDSPEDRERYQTVYASEEGSVAAPTAGLHFTRELLHELAERRFDWVELHLHVGYGTFSPVRQQNIRRHRMHREYLVISPECAQTVAQARADGRPVVAVGTTTARALEGCVAAHGRLTAFRGWTDIFLYPGFAFQVVDGLITNFHLPESSLLILVAAFAGRKRVLDAYAEAVQRQYRFFSYGDAMLII